MKVALLRQTWNPFGGAERFVEGALAALEDRGVAVTLIARKWSGTRRPASLLVCNPFYVGRLWRDFGFARKALRLAQAAGFDLIQSHERIPGCSVFRAGDGVHASWLEQRARVLPGLQRLAQALSPWHRYTLRAEAHMFRHPALRAVICNSTMVRDDIARRYAVPETCLHVIYNGVDLDRFHPRLRQEHRAATRAELGIADAAPVVLYVGSGFERKGLLQLIAAIARMRARDAVLLVVGEDKHAARYRKAAERMGIAARVHWLGGREDVRPYLGAADLFALPTLYDPFPNAALEALASGLPILTSTSCGAAEIVTPGESGYVCDALDLDALAANLDTLCRPGAAEAMRQAARMAAEAFSREAMAGRLIGLYKDLLARANETPRL